MNKKVTTVALAGLMAVSTGVSASVSRWNGLGLINTFVADVQDTWTLPTALLDNGDALYVEFGPLGGASPVPAGTTTGGPGVNDAGNVAWGGVHFSALGGQVGLWTGRPLSTDFLVPLGTGYAPGTLTNNTPNPAFLAGNPQGSGFAAGLIGTSGAFTNFGGFTTLTSDVDLLWGMNVNDNTQIAVGINKASGQGAGIAATGTGGFVRPAIAGVRNGTEFLNDGSAFGVSLGLGMSEVGPLSGLWAGLSFQSATLQEVYTDDGLVAATKEDTKDSLSVTDINLRVAGEAAGDDNMSQLFDLSVAMESGKAERAHNFDTNADGTIAGAAEIIGDTITSSAMNIALGWAMLGTGEKGMGASGLIVNFGSTSNEQVASADSVPTAITMYETSNIGLAWAAGTEVKAKDYLTVRAGVSGDIFGSNSRKNTFTPVAPGVATVDEANGHVPGGATASVGIGVALGDVMIDGVLNQDFLYSGPFFVSGIGEAINTQVSLTYAWGGQK